MKRTARKYPPPGNAEQLLVLIGGIVMLAIAVAPIVWLAGALLSGNLVWSG